MYELRVAKEAVSAAWQTKTRYRSERRGKPNKSPATKPRLCVKTMLAAPEPTVDAAKRVSKLGRKFSAKFTITFTARGKANQ